MYRVASDEDRCVAYLSRCRINNRYSVGLKCNPSALEIETSQIGLATYGNQYVVEHHLQQGTVRPRTDAHALALGH